MSLQSFAGKAEPVLNDPFAFEGSTFPTKGGGDHSRRSLFRRRFVTNRGNTQRNRHAPPSMTSSDQSSMELDVDDMSSQSFPDEPEPVLDGHGSDPFVFEGLAFPTKEEEDQSRKRRKTSRMSSMAFPTKEEDDHSWKRRKTSRPSSMATRDDTRQNTYAPPPMTSSDPLGMECVDVDTAITTNDNWMHNKRVLSLSLFRDDAHRRRGAVDLLDQIPEGWDVVFYVDSSIEDALRAQLVEKKARVKDVTRIGVRGQYRVMWRFLETLESHKHGGRLVAIGDVDPTGRKCLIGFLNKLPSQYAPGNHLYVVTMLPDWMHTGAVAVYGIPDWLNSFIGTEQHLTKAMTHGEVLEDNKHKYQWLSNYIKVLGTMRVSMHRLAPGSQRMCVIPKGDTPDDREWHGPVEFKFEPPQKNVDIVECPLHHWYSLGNAFVGEVMLRLVQVHLEPTGSLNCTDDTNSVRMAVNVPTVRIQRDHQGALQRLELIEAPAKGKCYGRTHTLWYTNDRHHTKANRMGCYYLWQ